MTKEPKESSEQKAARLATEILNNIPYCPWVPNGRVDDQGNILPGLGPQQQFLLDFGRESLYGGAAGGGKSIALMMSASQFLNVPGYSALLLRKSYSDLTKPGALMDIGEQWWGGIKGTKFDTQENTWYFETPAGGQPSRIVFGYLDKTNDKLKYQGGAYHYVGFDELTQQKEDDYRYLFSRMRRVTDPKNPLSRVPIRMRGTANPGGPGHSWVYKRFISPWEAWKTKGARRPPRNFYPALISDNPMLDQEDYVQSLMELDPVTRAQLMRGDWNIRPEGRMFKREWFRPISIHDVPTDCAWVRFWDMASTEADPDKESKKGGPDFTAGALIGRHADGRYFIADIRHWRQSPAQNDKLLRATALSDTQRVTQVIEEEGGSSGKVALHHYRNGPFLGIGVRGVPSSGGKELRAGPVASHADNGEVYYVVDGNWDIEAFLEEIEQFPDPGVHDDQVDAVSGAFAVLARQHIGRINFGVNLTSDFVRANPWRPDVTAVSENADLAAEGELRGENLRHAREVERNIRNAVASAWAV